MLQVAQPGWHQQAMQDTQAAGDGVTQPSFATMTQVWPVYRQAGRWLVFPSRTAGTEPTLRQSTWH